MNEIKKTAIVGMGSLGTLYASLITDALGKDSVYFVMDSERFKRYGNKPVYVNGKEYDFPCVSACDAEQADLIIVAVKATGLRAALETVSPCVGEDTVIMSIMNGISSEEILAERFGSDKMIYTVAQGMEAMKVGDTLTFVHSGILYIGALTAGQEANLRRVSDFLTKCGIAFAVEEDILHRLWSKFMLNVGVNQTCMVYGCTYGDVCVEGEPRDTMFAAMREVIEVARKSGIMLSEKDLEEYDRVIKALAPEGMPSMAQDRRAGRPSEVEIFAGTMIALGKETGVPTPVNDRLYERVKEIEAAEL